MMTKRCETCGQVVPVSAEAVRVTCRGDIRLGEPMHPDIGHDFQEEKRP